MSNLLEIAGHVVALAPADTITNPGAKVPPGMGNTFENWISYAKYIGLVAGAIGIIVCGIMMMIGRRNRHHLAAEGASGLVWVIAGLTCASLAVGITTSILG
ncbi:hypothetical protein EDD99_8156 [Streptomyces sp. 846.5]|nr:hypothetical protein [Streptomyces sp. 846.5]TDT93346.1 hypothetical protein EDD99_8156 [Streptomyces sp. 846.5]